MPTSATNGSRRNTIGLTRIQKCSLYATCAQKPAAPYPNHRSRRRRQKFGPAKRVVVQKAPRTSDSGNISATLFAFITVTICRLSRRNLRDFYSSFLSRKAHRHDETIATRPGYLRPSEAESGR